MVKMKKTHSSGGEGGTVRLDASLALDEMGLLPEEVAVLRMIHSVNLD